MPRWKLLLSTCWALTVSLSSVVTCYRHNALLLVAQTFWILSILEPFLMLLFFLQCLLLDHYLVQSFFAIEVSDRMMPTKRVVFWPSNSLTFRKELHLHQVCQRPSFLISISGSTINLQWVISLLYASVSSSISRNLILSRKAIFQTKS
jgi:hypothetical protein